MAKVTVCGIGINDAGYSVSNCPFYKCWLGVMKRCYSKREQAKYPTYRDCTIDETWHKFSIFSKWMQKQQWQNNQIDKDILSIGNKHYSPETCVFVPRQINTLINSGGHSTRKKTDLPVGVHLDREKYRAQLSVNNKTHNLGSFTLIKDAQIAYLDAKAELILKVSLSQPRQIKAGLVKHAQLLSRQKEALSK